VKHVLVLVGLAVAVASFAADERPAHLLVLDLYAAGEYADCRGLSARLIEDYEAGAIKVTAADMAKVYMVAACLADVYRGAGYAESVEQNIDRALALDPNVDPSLAGTRAFVADRFTEQRATLIAAQGPAGRRFSFGLVLAAEGPGGIHWRNVPLVGVRLGIGVLPWLTIEGSALLMPKEPPLDEGELRIGAAFRPAFVLNRPMLVLDASYVATRQDGWTHGVTFGAGAEVALDFGLSVRLDAELIRIEGTEAPDPDAGAYPVLVLFGAPIIFSLPRISLSVSYSF
jgi:hypothetical protein